MVSGCRACVLVGADLADVVVVEPTVPRVAFLFPAFPLLQRLELIARTIL